jgi:Fic family protein
MSNTKIIPDIVEITERKVPSVIALENGSKLVIGTAARELGLIGRTNTYHFKTDLGKLQDDSLYEARTDRLGRPIPAKPKPYWVRDPDTLETKSFTPLEAVREYLNALIPEAERPGRTLILGEPTLDEQWRENYKKNMRHVVTEVGFKDVLYFPEPFAVYQYYRHVEKKIPDKNESQTVLVVDFGGGTFDCCVIKTTRSGELARSGAHSQPLGFQSSTAAGEAVDVELLKLIRGRAEANRIVFKDDPIERARHYPQSLWSVENVKIALSVKFSSGNHQNGADLAAIREEVVLPAGTFHADQEVRSWLSLEDLSGVVSSLWKRIWGKTILACHKAAETKLGNKITAYDVILIAGGSAHLPNLSSHVLSTLPNQIDVDTKIVIGGQAGAAVAKGIAIECREQSDRRPELISNRLVVCLLSDLHLRVGRNKGERLPPKVRDSNKGLKNAVGLVYQAPRILEQDTISVSLEFAYQPKGVLHYWFHGRRAGDDDPLNFVSTTVRIPGDKFVDKKFELLLEINDDGTLTPSFHFKRQGRSLDPVSGQPFNLGDQRVCGKSYLGVDFGTCNSYVASYLVPDHEYKPSKYPEYEITRETAAYLISLEEQFRHLLNSNAIDTQRVLNHARDNELEFVFHSNKIEGNRLTRGETEAVLSTSDQDVLNTDKREAINLREAYRWVLRTHSYALDDFSAFCRHVNGMLLSGIESKAGRFRQEDVRINGMEYQPPPWGSVDAFMSRLTQEIRESRGRTSGLELAVRAHTKLAAIHPFVDGNGRTARLCAAAILLSHELPILVLNSDDKERYLDALSKSNAGIMDSLATLFGELLETSIESITQPDSSRPFNGDDTLGEETTVESGSEANEPIAKLNTGPSELQPDRGARLARILKEKSDLRYETHRLPAPRPKSNTTAATSSSSRAQGPARPRSSRGVSSTSSRPVGPDSLCLGNIVAFTFTEKAAAELKERIVTRTRQALGDVPGWRRCSSAPSTPSASSC